VQMKRYRPVVGSCGADAHRIDYEECANGEFVRYADVLAEHERLRGEVANLDAMLTNIAKHGCARCAGRIDKDSGSR
jgi:hypothetical protein